MSNDPEFGEVGYCTANQDKVRATQCPVGKCGQGLLAAQEFGRDSCVMRTAAWICTQSNGDYKDDCPSEEYLPPDMSCRGCECEVTGGVHVGVVELEIYEQFGGETSKYAEEDDKDESWQTCQLRVL